MIRKSLTEIANFHGTDKGTIGPTSEWPAHNYTDIYEAYFSNLRWSAITILEIGIGVRGDSWPCAIARGRNEQGGASLKTWHDYFPNASIYGLDINVASHLDNDRIRTFVADQGSVEELEAFVKSTQNIGFDIIIDDGSHRPDHQMISLSILFKNLKAGGLYCIEDLLANGLGDNASGPHACGTVKNTRSVLKHFKRTGEFLEPHALIDPDYLAENIMYLSFHVPRIRTKGRPVLHPASSLRKMIKCKISTQYEAGTESLAVLRKS